MIAKFFWGENNKFGILGDERKIQGNFQTSGIFRVILTPFWPIFGDV